MDDNFFKKFFAYTARKSRKKLYNYIGNFKILDNHTVKIEKA
jgi:hypothetical protein